MTALVTLVGLASGCGSALVIHREVPRPAAIPARGYPVVYVAASPGAASHEAAETIARHLEGGAIRVVRVGPDVLLGDASLEDAATLALLVTVTTGETSRTQMSQVPTVRCAPDTPCYGYPERFPEEVRVQVGVLLVRAFDPRSASELGRAVIREEESEPSPIAAQLAVLDRLRARAPGLFDIQTDVLDLELDPLSEGVLHAVIEDARAGRVHAARLALEAALRDDTLEVGVRAAVAFDLGQLIRADVDTSADDRLAEETARFSAAEAQLLAAIQLAPNERHERALAQLRAERTAREDVRAQETAADTNFATAPPP